jgi:hypothetical protein
MPLRDTYCQKIEAQIDELNARLSLARARSRKLAAEGKIAAAEELDDVEKKLADAKGKLTALRNATESAWGEMKAGMEKAWVDLRDAAKRAFDKFG